MATTESPLDHCGVVGVSLGPMFLAAPLRHALVLSVALAALLGGDALHGALHDGELPPAENVGHDSELHGDGCEHGAEIEALPHDAHCLLCSGSREHALDLPDTTHAPDALEPAACAPPRDDARLRNTRPPCAPLGARAPPRDA